LFEDELHRTLRLISRMPEAGVRWPTARNPRLRRFLMMETRHHVYFHVDQLGDSVVILAVWGAQRGRGPSL
jgi:plasmid stabilization system protein ParE